MTEVLIGVDWGSSNVRAFRIAEGGAVIETRRAGDGVLTGTGPYDKRLRALLGDWQESRAPILMCGMIGSDRGWQNVPYAEVPIPPHDLKPVRVAFDRPAYIVPGICYRDGETCEVMRGEETLLAGVGYASMTFCLPGTHSKWAVLSGGVLERFRTYMTGEICAALLASGALATGVAQIASQDVFEQGARAAKHGVPRALFQARARRLLGTLKPEHTASFVDGVLIGSEFVHEEAVVAVIVASGAIAEQYASLRGFRIVDPEPLVARGLHTIAQRANLI